MFSASCRTFTFDNQTRSKQLGSTFEYLFLFFFLWMESLFYCHLLSHLSQPTSVFFVTSTPSTCSKEVLNVLTNIYLAIGETYHCRTLNWFCLTRWNFMIKNVQFQCSNISKVAKMIYNSILDYHLIVFAPNLAVQSLAFGQRLRANFTNTSDIFHNGCMALTSRCFLAVCETWCSCLNGGKVQNDVFPISIYEFNI